MTSLLLMAAQDCARAPPRAVAARMLALHDAVRARGHRMHYLAPLSQYGASHRQSELLDRIEQTRPDALLRVPTPTDADAYCLCWPKDALQAFGDVIAVAPADAARRIVRQLGYRSQTSPWCEGGLMLRAGDVLVLSSAAGTGDPSALGGVWRMHCLPHPYTAPAYRAAGPPEPFGRDHIDLDCALLRAPSGQLLLLAAERYHAVYESHLRTLARRLPAELFVVPQAEADLRALNVVALPPSCVILPGGCPVVRRFLRQHFGSDQVLSVRIDARFNYNGGQGGLGCMSTVLPLKAAAFRAPRARVVD